jgi:hypothetical protein
MTRILSEHPSMRAAHITSAQHERHHYSEALLTKCGAES